MGTRFIAIDQNGNILRDGIITDITGGFVSSSRKIREDGEFFISVSTAPIDSMFFRYIEIKSGSKIMTFSHKEGDTSGIHKITFVPNARTIFGHIFDSINKSKPLQELKVKVLNQDIAVRTDEYGRYTLRGVPFDEVTVEIDDTLKVTVPKVFASEERILDKIYYSF